MVSYCLPKYIDTANIDTIELRFKWDDTKASELFEFDSDPIVEKLPGVTPRAQIAMGIGIFEWIAGRFKSVFSGSELINLAEAGWCGQVSSLYMHYTEFDRRKWIGPVKGPIWCAVTWFVPMIFYLDDEMAGLDELESGIAYLTSLALHVLPNPDAFTSWLNGCIDRLVSLYPQQKIDPFDDLFAEEDWGGPVVPREALDLHFNYKLGSEKQLFSAFLKTVDYHSNPYLKTPNEMIEEGFEGTPYVV